MATLPDDGPEFLRHTVVRAEVTARSAIEDATSVMQDVAAGRIGEASQLAVLDGGHRNHRKRFNKLRVLRSSSETAGWRSTRILTSDFLDSLPLIGRHPLVDLQCFCLSLIRCDLMHACYLGMCLVTGASVIWELIANGHFGPQHLHLDIKLASAYGALLVHCRKNGLTLDCRCFTKGTFGSPHAATSTTANRAPELHVKAHDSKIITGDCCDSFSVIKP